MAETHIPFLIQHTPPATEPVSLSEVKAQLRITCSSEDDHLNRLVSSARVIAEKYLGRSLITQSWMLTYDDYAPSRLALPRGPVQSVTSLKIVARDGTETTINSSKYYLNSGKTTLVIDTPLVGHIVEVIYTAGYGDADDVPESIKQGMLAHINAMYDRRTANLPLNEVAQAYYNPYRVMRLS